MKRNPITRNLAILIFDEVEVLDFAGPFEVFSVTGLRDKIKPFNVYTVSLGDGPVIARNGLSINAHHTTTDCPRPDILLIPGGFGTRPLLKDAAALKWIRETSDLAEMTLSVCTGALLLAKAGLLTDMEATTHHGSLDFLAELDSTMTVRSETRFVDNGAIILSAGVSAGIDMSFHVVKRLLGADLAAEAAHYMEYEHYSG
jgi:transcriptional regulator GlxA family with amidase domain